MEEICRGTRLANVKGPSWKSNGHFQIIGHYITYKGNMKVFNYVTIIKYNSERSASRS
jgi:hypothetical protein